MSGAHGVATGLGSAEAPEPHSGLRPTGAIPCAVSEKLQAAIEKGKTQGKLALYFGCLNGLGHYLHDPRGRKVWDASTVNLFPWDDHLLDGGLLKNGKRQDVYDGSVYWTVGGLALWYAFYWWDRSADSRGASNSGFYVRGFGWPEPQEAFDYACAVYPNVIARQKHRLVLQEPRRASVDTHPQGGDVKQAPFMGGAVAKPDAQTPPPSPNGENNG